GPSGSNSLIGALVKNDVALGHQIPGHPVVDNVIGLQALVAHGGVDIAVVGDYIAILFRFIRLDDRVLSSLPRSRPFPIAPVPGLFLLTWFLVPRCAGSVPGLLIFCS